jgi:hypothetical protein
LAGCGSKQDEDQYNFREEIDRISKRKKNFAYAIDADADLTQCVDYFD